MSAFAPKDRTDRGLEGDFRVDATPQTAEEESYLRSLNGALNLLVTDETSGQTSGFPGGLLKWRKEMRKSAVKELRAVAQTFADSAEGATDEETRRKMAIAARDNVEQIDSRYRADLPKFAVIKDRTPPRLENDFQIDVIAPPELGDTDRFGIDKLHSVLDQLADDELKDTAAQQPTTLRTARRKHRAGTVAQLRAETERHCNGEVSAALAANNAAEIRDKYTATIPTITIADSTPQRFRGDFEIKTGNYQAAQDEQRYLENLKKVLDSLAYDEQRADPAANYSPEVLAARKKERERAASELRSEAEDFPGES